MPLLLPKTTRIDPRFELTLHYRPIKHYAGGYYAGEGVLGWFGGSYRNHGFVIRVTNRDTAERTYHFDVAVFKPFRRKHLDQTLVKTIHRLKPGYTADVVVELHAGQWLSRSVLEDMAVKNEHGERIARYAPRLNVLAHIPLWRLLKLHYVAGAALVLLAGRVGLHLLT